MGGGRDGGSVRVLMTGEPTGGGEALPRPVVLPSVPPLEQSRSYDRMCQTDGGGEMARRWLVGGVRAVSAGGEGGVRAAPEDVVRAGGAGGDEGVGAGV